MSEPMPHNPDRPDEDPAPGQPRPEQPPAGPGPVPDQPGENEPQA